MFDKSYIIYCITSVIIIVGLCIDYAFLFYQVLYINLLSQKWLDNQVHIYTFYICEILGVYI